MPIVSIVLFVFCIAILIYAGIAALRGKLVVPINRSASVKNLTKKYVRKVALLLTFMSIAPFIGGILGLFIEIVIIPIIVFFVLFIALLIIGIKIIMKQ